MVSLSAEHNVVQVEEEGDEHGSDGGALLHGCEGRSGRDDGLVGHRHGPEGISAYVCMPNHVFVMLGE